MAPEAWVHVLTFYYLVDLMEETPLLLWELKVYTYHQISPNAEVVAFNRMLWADVEFSKRMEVQHWLRVFDNRPTEFPQRCVATLIELVGGRAATIKRHGEPRVALDTAIMYIVWYMDLFLEEYEKCAGAWNVCLNSLHERFTVRDDPERHLEWRQTDRRIIEQLKDKLCAKQQEGKHRVLPYAYKLQLWLLPFSAAKCMDGAFVLQALIDPDGDHYL